MTQRQASTSSYGSSDASSISQAVANVGTIGGTGQDGGGVSELLSRDASIQDSVFGILYMISKDPFDGNSKIGGLKILFDFLQMLVFLLTHEWGWDINYGHRVWQWFRRAQLQYIIVEKGFDFYKIIFWVVAASLGMLIAALAFLSYEFKTSRIQQLQWAVKICKVFVFLFFDVFYISLLSFFLTATDCLHGYNPTTGTLTRGYSHFFKGKSCTAMPGTALMAVGAAASVIVFFVGLLVALRDTVAKDYLAPGALATAQSETAVKIHIAKTVIAIFAIDLQGLRQLQSIVLVIAYWYMLWCLFRRVPYFSYNANMARGGLYGMLAVTSLLLLLRCYNVGGKDGHTTGITNVMLGLLPLGLALGLLAMYLRIRHVRRIIARHFAELPEPAAGQPAPEISHKFFDDYECELTARLCLKRDHRGRIDEKLARAADEAFKLGIKQFQDSSMLAINYSNFLNTVRLNSQASSTQLSRASKLIMGWGVKLQVFIRNMDEKSKASHKTGDGAMDLMSYVEFQQNFKVLLSAHTAALKAIRHFWRELLRGDVTFQHLTRALYYMDASEGKADRTYQMILERYPKSVKLLRAYGKYLEEVKHDPWGANKYYGEADRLEDLQAEADREAMLSHVDGQGEGTMNTSVDDSTDAVCVISDIGIIQFTNKICNKMFGYKLGELEGKNVSCLMPQPFAGQHNTYLRNYKVTGKAKVLNKVREVIGVTKERNVFPIRLAVTKLQQGDQDCYMGVIKPMEDDFKRGVVWLTTGGQVLCCNRGFTDIFGFKSSDLVGRNIKVVAANPEDMESHVIEVADLSKLHNDEEADDENKTHAKFTSLCKHKYGAGTFNVDVEVQFAGTQTMRILVLKMTNKDQGQGIMAMDSQGIIVYASNAIDSMLGYEPGALGANQTPLAKVLPMPYAALHHKFVQEFAQLAQSGMAPTPKATSCVTGRVVAFSAKGGRLVPVRMRISLLKEGEELVYAATVVKAPIPPSNGWGMMDASDLQLEHARLRLLLRHDGRIVATDAPASSAVVNEPVFGLRREDVQGLLASDVIDLLQASIQQARLFNANVNAEAVVGPFMDRIIQKSNALGILSWKVGLALGSGRGQALTPARMVIKTAAAAGIQLDDLIRSGQLESANVTGDLRSMYLVELYNTDALQGSLETSKSGEVRRADFQASLILGNKPAMLEGKHLGQLLVGQIGNKVTDMLGIRIGRKIGEKMVYDVMHAEGDEFRCLVLGSQKNEEGDRYIVLLGIPPGSASGCNFRRVQEIVSQDTGMGGGGGGGLRFAAGARMDEDRGRDSGMNVRFADVRSETNASEAGAKKKKRAGTVKGGNADSEASSPPDSEAPGSDESEAEGGKVTLTQDKTKEVEDDQRSVGSASEASSATGISGEFRRAKRYKRLLRLLASPRARKPVSDLQLRSKLLSWLVVLIHLGIFVASRILLTSQTNLVVSVKNVGDTLRHMQNSMISCRVLENQFNNSGGHPYPLWSGGRYLGNPPYNGTLAGDILKNQTEAKLLSDLGLFESTIRSAFRYVLQKRYGSTAYKDYAVNLYTVLEWIDVEPMHYVNDTAWDMFNIFIRKGRQVASIDAFPEWQDQVYNWRHFRFVLDNGPFTVHDTLSTALEVEGNNAVSNMKLLQNVLMALMIFEGVFVLPLFAGIMFITMRRLQAARISLFSVFLCVPRPAIIALASREVTLDEDESEGDDDIDEDNEWMKRIEDQGQGQEGGDKAGAKNQPQKLMKINLKQGAERRKLRSSNALEMIKVVTPFLVYTCLVVSIYGAALSILNSTTRPLKDLISAEHLLEYATRTRFWAHELVLAKTSADQDLYRWRLQISATLLYTLYHSLLYGTGADYAGLDGADPTLKGSLFRNKAVQKLLFQPGCLRLPDTLPCFPPSNPYYELTTNGLDTILNAVYDNAMRLTQELPSLLSLNNDKFEFMWAVGPTDFNGGLQKFTKLYVDDNFTPYRTIEVMEIILLVAIVLCNVGYVIMIFPFVSRASKESKRVAQLMSLLPDDMDIETLVIEANGLLDEESLGLSKKEEEKKKAAKKAKKEQRRRRAKKGGDSDSDSDDDRALRKLKKGGDKDLHRGRKNRKVVPVDSEEEGSDDGNKGSKKSRKGKKKGAESDDE